MRWAIAGLIVLTAACTSSLDRQHADGPGDFAFEDLVRDLWIVESFDTPDGRVDLPATFRSGPSLRFQRNGTVAVDDGCNVSIAGFAVDDGWLAVDRRQRWTVESCPDLQQDLFHDAWDERRSIERDDDSLTVQGGGVAMTLERVVLPDLPLEGIRWKLAARYDDEGGELLPRIYAELVIDAAGGLAIDASCIRAVGPAIVTDTTVSSRRLQTLDVCPFDELRPQPKALDVIETVGAAVSGGVEYVIADEVLWTAEDDGEVWAWTKADRTRFGANPTGGFLPEDPIVHISVVEDQLDVEIRAGGAFTLVDRKRPLEEIVLGDLDPDVLDKLLDTVTGTNLRQLDRILQPTETTCRLALARGAPQPRVVLQFWQTQGWRTEYDCAVDAAAGSVPLFNAALGALDSVLASAVIGG